MDLYKRIVNEKLLVRRINITANNIVNENLVKENEYEQMDLFIDYNELDRKRKKEKAEKEIQKAMINIKDKYGKNAILKGMNLHNLHHLQL